MAVLSETIADAAAFRHGNKSAIRRICRRHSYKNIPVILTGLRAVLRFKDLFTTATVTALCEKLLVLLQGRFCSERPCILAVLPSARLSPSPTTSHGWMTRCRLALFRALTVETCGIGSAVIRRPSQ